jgi:hypothetical protein
VEEKDVSQYRIGKIDLSQIECRLLNTVAGQHDVVEKFRNGIDLYSELASQFYGFAVDKTKPAERGTGKQLELSCGYGAGGPTIVRTARAGTYGPPVHLTDEQGLAARDLYRGTHPAVVRLWKIGDRMLYHLASGADVAWVPNAVHVFDHRLWHMPSGLWMDFTSLEYHTDESGEQYWRMRVKNGYRKMYGAKLIENMIQFLASFPIRQAIVHARQELGLVVPLTVHDDIFVLIENNKYGEDKFQQLVDYMSRSLDWLPECPIAVEAKIGDNLE